MTYKIQSRRQRYLEMVAQSAWEQYGFLEKAGKRKMRAGFQAHPID
jgi:hypothetical protein